MRPKQNVITVPLRPLRSEAFRCRSPTPPSLPNATSCHHPPPQRFLDPFDPDRKPAQPSPFLLKQVSRMTYPFRRVQNHAGTPISVLCSVENYRYRAGALGVGVDADKGLGKEGLHLGSSSSLPRFPEKGVFEKRIQSKGGSSRRRWN